MQPEVEMSGREHYKEAERLLDEPCWGDDADESRRKDNLAAAQVHATLALADATYRNHTAAVLTDNKGSR